MPNLSRCSHRSDRVLSVEFANKCEGRLFSICQTQDETVVGGDGTMRDKITKEIFSFYSVLFFVHSEIEASKHTRAWDAKTYRE